jgi:hypothetical protein
MPYPFNVYKDGQIIEVKVVKGRVGTRKETVIDIESEALFNLFIPYNKL